MAKKNKIGAQILKLVGINTFIAIKANYNSCMDRNDFYNMLNRRSQYKDAKELGYFLRSELHYHFKEYAQYQ